MRMRSLEAGQDVAGPDECQYTHTRFQDVVGFIPDSGQRERHGAKTLGVAAPRRWASRRQDVGDVESIRVQRAINLIDDMSDGWV